MLRHWVRRASPPPSWSALVRALQSPVMDQGGIAEEIKKMPVSVLCTFLVMLFVYVHHIVCVCVCVCVRAHVCMASVFIVSTPQVTCKCYVIAYTSTLTKPTINYLSGHLTCIHITLVNSLCRRCLVGPSVRLSHPQLLLFHKVTRQVVIPAALIPPLPPTGPLSVDKHLKTVREATWDIRAKWHGLGVELGIKVGTLEVGHVYVNLEVVFILILST